MSKWKKVAAITAPVVMALSATTPADAKVLLMGDGGWEVSFDGSVNNFYSYSSVDSAPKQVEGYGATRNGPGGIKLGGTIKAGEESRSYSAITTGLLPAVWGVNIKAPTTNGLDMSARLGIYPQTQNAHTKNQFGAQIDLREIFFQVDGSFGSVLVGRTLSLYQGKNILTDMTLFGVGAPNNGGGGTTLGRIGFGYVYPNFNAAIRFTTPDMNGFKMSAGIYQPSHLKGGTSEGAFATDELETPRFEGELSYAGGMGGVTMNSWFSGMYQRGKRAKIEAVAGKAASDEIKTESWGTAAGMQMGFAGAQLTASGYWGQGLGTTLMLDTDGFDQKGKGRRAVGYIAQGTYGFGQGTSIGASYGLNRQFNTAQDTLDLAALANVMVREQNMLDVMVWHDINKNLRLVGEWSKVQAEWQDNSDLDVNTFSVGGFFFW